MLNNDSHKIRLGIDAKWFFEGPPSGKMVVANLVDEIIRNNNGRFEIYLFIENRHKLQAETYFSEDVKLICLPKVPNLLANALLIPKAARKHGLDVMLFQNFGSLWPTKLFKIVYIHDVLFLDYPEYYTRLERFHFRQMKQLAARADLIITISETEKRRLIKNHIGDNIEVVYHGINEAFQPLTSQSKERIQSVVDKYHLPQRYLLYVGRVNVRKNLKNLVKSISLLHETDLKLVIVGECPGPGHELFKYIGMRQLSDKIIFTGHVPEDDLRLIYARATVFCFPSYAEGFGLPPLEAMQCGVPVIVSNRTAMPEVCGEAAVYIDPDDVRDIARKIHLLLNNDRLYDEKRAEGLRHASNFSWNRSANAILTLITNAYAN